MPALHVRDVPAEVLDVIATRAAEEGVSRQALLHRLITDWAAAATPREAARAARELALRSQVTAADLTKSAA